MTDPVARLNAALEGRYIIERELGQGGMATVYLADDLKHDRKVALKVLKPELAAVVGAERFLAEIKTTANLQHPHILPLFDSGEADSFLYYVMPYVEGETLSEKIDREKQLPVEEAVGIAIAVAHALQIAHDAGIIHRDIKPGNILLSRGEPLVADFGIALAVGAASGTRLTETGLSVGTPYYMSPEQATGDQVIGAASDTYAIACVLFEMLTGDPPFSGSTAQAVLGKIIQGVPVSATAIRKTVPPNVDAAIRKALEKLPADRFRSAQEFSNALSDPGFRYGAESATEGGAQTVRWKRTAVAFATLFAVASSVAIWAVGRPVPTSERPVERYAQPFNAAQMPQSGLQFTSFTLSRDGSTLVYHGRPDGAGGGTRFFVRRWDVLEAEPLSAPAGALFPTLSPDGQSLAYGVPGRIDVIPLSGGVPNTVAEASTPYVYWGKDDYLYFVNDGGGSARVPGAGGAVETLTEAGEGEAYHTVSDVIRDGQIALFTALPGLVPTGEMRALDLATRETTVIGPGGLPRYANSGHLVYLRADSTLMAVAFSPEELSMSGAPLPMLDDVVWFTISETGKLFYQTSDVAGGGFREFVWVTRAGAVSPVDPGWSFSDPDVNIGWSLSPDGSRLAFRAHEGGNYDIWTKELDDGPVSRLTFDEAEDRRPSWTPDGRRVTFLSQRAGNVGVFWKVANGTGVTEAVFDYDGQIGQGL